MGDNATGLSKATPGASEPPKGKPVVFGIYGLPGSGKSVLLRHLRHDLGEERFAFFEGSELIARIVPGGLHAFKRLESEEERNSFRGRALRTVVDEASGKGKTAVVTGHIIFWNEGDKEGTSVWTPDDQSVYTHIIYLDLSAQLIAERRNKDHRRYRERASVEHLKAWRNAEKDTLRKLCYAHGILFLPVRSTTRFESDVSRLIRNVSEHSEEGNLRRAKYQLSKMILSNDKHLRSVLVMDGDRTLAADDTEALFWSFAAKTLNSSSDITEQNPVKSVFESFLPRYSYNAFLQASLLYGEISTQVSFEALCMQAAGATRMYGEMVEFVRLAQSQARIGVVVVTCGLQRIWEKILDICGLSQVKVIGGGHNANGLIVTPAVKAALVTHLQNFHSNYVCAFGDSPLDLPMLKVADRAVIVVGENNTRSKTMDTALLHAVDSGSLKANQVLLPATALPRLDTIKLPVVQLLDFEFVKSIFDTANQEPNRSPYTRRLKVASKSAAQLLMTPARNSRVADSVLRGAHHNIGWYLAVHCLPDLIGVEEYQISHVQGHQTDGYRLHEEEYTLIVALMRGGGSMALGVSDAFPSAKVLYAFRPDDIEDHCLAGIGRVILVDSVVNSGKTILEFIQHIRMIVEVIPITVVAGVVHCGAIYGSEYAEMLAKCDHLLVTLRLSDHKYVVGGATDTGDRLFNTTHLP
ncbi:uracil phosphoribosyltransferase-domain-containing protein [Hypoxylon sp. FL1150]|nr:uracil phosphoribosyltransferase-domain-containing protein [Hypoxylon sp. FL1150]